jgi:hypothetical protein
MESEGISLCMVRGVFQQFQQRNQRNDVVNVDN